MLTIYTSNKIEALLTILSHNIRSQPLDSPFDAEIIAVNNIAMERWLQINLAQQIGVEANYHFPLPARLLWDLLKQIFPNIPEQDPLSRPALQWKIFSTLPDLLADQAFSSLNNYVQNDQTGLKRWQLAGKIADSFDRYQYYRDDWLNDAVDDNRWQALLWQAITRNLPQHKTQLVEGVKQALLEQSVDTRQLPKRISLFAPSTLPPLLLNTLLLMAESIQLDFYLLAPTNQYWLDLISEKQAAKLRLNKPETAVYMETGNRLLSSWGRQGQVFFDQLITASEQAENIDCFVEPDTQSVLQQIQHDIFMLNDPKKSGEKIHIDNDQSIIVHCCHSPLREIQVLHDQLLDILNSNSQLRPEDILVVAPDISQYAPYIEAVFHKSEHQPTIPWNISDTANDKDIPLIRIFLQLFSLPDSRFERSEILAYLDVPEVQQKFGLDSDDIEQLEQWLEAGAIRWGKDAHHKAGLGLPDIAQNTWNQAQDRLFMGYAIGENDGLFDEIAPISQIEGNSSEILGKFWSLFEQLKQFSQRLAQDYDLQTWHEIVNELLDSLFDDAFLDESHLQTIRETINDIVQQAEDYAEPISRQLLRKIIENRLADHASLHAFMSGGVSFSGFKPMRNLPFKVIVVLGLNDGDFPRQSSKTEFDLMQQHYRVSDPDSRNEDRYLFLETLLSAQEQLILSYIGRNIKDNTEKQASVLLKELLDYLDARFISDTALPYSETITTIHRLQPFHPDYFLKPKSYAQYWCQLAEKIQTNTSSPQQDWGEYSLEAPDNAWRQIDVNQLIRFIRHPIRYFFQQRLGIYLEQDEATISDDEPFELNALERYKLKARLLDEWLQKRAISSTESEFYAEGILPHGKMAEDVIEKVEEEINPLLDELNELLADKQPEPVSIQLNFRNHIADDWQIQGTIRNIYPELGLVEIKSGKLSGIDKLSFWINYLLYRLAESEAPASDGYYIDIEGVYHVKADNISQAEATEYIEDLLAHYWTGISRPLALLPKSSAELIKQGEKFKGKNSITWHGTGQFNAPIGDLHDSYIQLAIRGIQELPIDSEEFKLVTESMYRFNDRFEKG